MLNKLLVYVHSIDQFLSQPVYYSPLCILIVFAISLSISLSLLLYAASACDDVASLFFIRFVAHRLVYV